MSNIDINVYITNRIVELVKFYNKYIDDKTAQHELKQRLDELFYMKDNFICHIEKR